MRGIVDLAEEVLASRNGFCTVESAGVLHPPIETTRPILCNIHEFRIDGSIAPGRGTVKINNPCEMCEGAECGNGG
jgi:hypothetical protein